MIKVSGAFVTRWHENWEIATSMAEPIDSYGDEQRRIEYFLESMKYDLAAVLLSEAKSSEPTRSSL